MNQDPSNIEKKLKGIKTPSIKTPLHQRQLKMDLMKIHERMYQGAPVPFITNLNQFMKKFLPATLVAVLALVVVLNNTGMFSSATASAKELVEQAISKVKVQAVKPETRTQAQLQDELSVLEKAKDAKDLAFLGEEKSGAQGKVKKLSFTDEKGKKVTIKFDENNSSDPVNIEKEGSEGQDEENVAGGTQESNESAGESGESKDVKSGTQENETTTSSHVEDSARTAVSGETKDAQVSDGTKSGEVEQDKTTDVKALEVNDSTSAATSTTTSPTTGNDL